MNRELISILPTVSKPTRYLGDELNAVRKDPDKPGLIRFALAFPDIYEVGMSHLGLKILYHILNSRDDVWAERAYAPWTDMEAVMRTKGFPLTSLESGLPLGNFDIVGFSLQYEMSYTGVLNMLELAQIPLLAADRFGGIKGRRYPLVIAGGPCAFNPEPMVDFIDLFVIGDGEEVITEIVDCYKIHRDEDREKLLNKMAEIEGVYVPLLFSVGELADGMLAVSGYPHPIRKRVIRDLDTAPYPVDYLVPFMRPIHDRAVIEVMRGCSRGCRFCQAGMIYRPVRERSSVVVERLAEELVSSTGYEELSLASLSTCDHSSIDEIVKRLAESLGDKKHVAISLPSLRADGFSIELAQKLASIGKTGLTFAPEVATERMQKVVNKHIPRDEVLSAVEGAFSAGWDSLKLYFMIGLPTETEKDVTEIACFIKEILQAALRSNRRASLNVSVSTFVPKAHTPFQWERQLSPDEVRQRQNLLMDEMGRDRRRGRSAVSMSFHSPEVSLLEGVFARGDRRLGAVLRIAHALGCRLDGWTECFNFGAWMQAFDQCGIDPNIYLKTRKPDQVMPWDHIDPIVTKDFLLAERDKACRSELTPDCRWGGCSQCGIRDMPGTEGRPVGCHEISHPGSSSQHSAFSVQHPVNEIQHPASRIRFQFAKRKALKFISHLDLINSFERTFRRAGVPVAYSHGFNPHPRLSLGTGLPVGTTSEAEFADVEFETRMEVDDFVSRTNEQLPVGLEILEAKEIPLKEQSLMAQISLASYIVRIPKRDALGIEKEIDSRINSILSMDNILIDRPNGRAKKTSRRANPESKTSRLVDIKPLVRGVGPWECIDGTLNIEMVLGDGKDGKVRPEEVIRLIIDGLVDNTEREAIISLMEIHKTGSFIEHQGRLFSPMEISRPLGRLET